MRTRPTRHLIYVATAYVCVLHVVWASLILWDPHAVSSTALYVIFTTFGSNPQTTAFGLLAAAALAVVGLLGRLPWAVVLMLPQQSLLLLSVAGAIGAMVAGHFADGVIRPPAFIIGDQIHVVLTAVFNAIAIMSTGIEPRNE